MGVALLCHARSRVARAIALLFAVACAVSAVSPAFAGGRAGAPPPRPGLSSAPTVVRELETSRTAESKTFLMSDGSFKLDLYTQPIHFKDASKHWKDIDPTLVQTPEYGISEVKASDYDIQIASDDVTDTPVSVSHNGWSFGMDLVGGEQSRVMAMGDHAVYPLAMTDTSLVYETGGNAVKDTLVLASKNAPDTFTFHMKLDGLSLYQSVSGPGYVLLDSKGKHAGRIDPLSVFDSALDANGEPKAVCASASVTVAPAEGGVDVTYHVPRGWMDDSSRVYPVKVDPQIVFSGNDDTCDTWYSSSSGGGSYATSDHLDVGKFSSSPDYRRSLISFDAHEIPVGVRIDSAVLNMYCRSNTSGGASSIYLHGVDNDWHGSAHDTWNETFGNGYLKWNSLGDVVDSRWEGYNKYVYWYPTAIVQSWFNGSRNWNWGFLLMACGESGAPAKSFWSAEYTTFATRQPHLTVNYTVPLLLGGSYDKASYAPGASVGTNVSVLAKTHPTNVQMQVKSGSTVRGRFLYTTFDPEVATYETYNVPGTDDYFSFDSAPGSGYTSGAVVPELKNCSVRYNGAQCDVHFAYKIGENYGDCQSNHLWAIDCDWASTNTWTDMGASYAVLPSRVSAPSAVTTASAIWWNEVGGPNNISTAGRGSAEIAWTSAASATGYKINLFDGNAWREVGSTTSTRWKSSGKGLYPTDAVISNLTAGATANPFLSGAGMDLRDDPRALYAKTAGTVWDDIPAYAFKVVPYNSAGSAQISDAATIPVALDSRTRHLAEAPRHTEADLDDIAGDAASAVLDRGALSISAGDLEIETYGPDAELNREYDSSRSSTGLLGAPGWRFSFERQLSVDATGATYLDEGGDAYRFRLVSGGYIAPTGMVATLAADTSVNGSARSIRFKDRSQLYFDSSGRFVAESDNNNQKTLVNWNASDVTIRAANGQSIVVSVSGGRATSAEYSTTSGTRHVDYSWNSSAGKATASYTYSGANASLTPTRSVEYAYSGSRITGVTLKAATHFAHLSGDARWDIVYSSGQLASVIAPTLDGANASVTSISAPSANGALTSATLTRTGKVNGSEADITETWTWNPDGSLASETNPRTTSESPAVTSYTYDATGEQASETDALGNTKRSIFDGRGNERYDINALGNMTANTYDANDDLVNSVDPLGCVTTNGYDALGNVIWTEKSLNANGEKAHTDFGYTVEGRKSFERQVLFAESGGTTHWLRTEYGYGNCSTDDPTTVAKKGQTQTSAQKPSGTFDDEQIALGAIEASRTDSLVTSSEYDAFGNQTRETDALGNYETSVFDLAGGVLESTDESRTLAIKHRYDALGHETQSWNEAGGAVIGYTETDHDVLGNVAEQRTYTTSGGIGTRALYKTSIHTRDSMGREIASDDSMVTGAVAHSLIDARGNVLKAWGEGLPTAKTDDDAYATVSIYDALDQTLSAREPAATAAEVSVYDADGQKTRQTDADGVAHLSRFDGAGNAIEESEVSTSGVATTRTTYDTAGRAVVTYDENDDATTATFDLADRQVASRGPETPSSPVVYNALGWTIAQTDSDAIPTLNTYDMGGRLIAESIGSGVDVKTSTSAYDTAGRTLVQTDKDSKCIRSVYDDFGRVIDQTQTKPAGLITRLVSTYDSLSRVLSTVESPSGVAVRNTYPLASQPGSPTIVATTYGAITTTLTVDSAGSELARTSSGSGVAFTRSVETTDAAGRITRWGLGSGKAWSSKTFDDMGRVSTQHGSAFASAGAYAYNGLGGRESWESLPLAGGAGDSVDRAYEYTPDGRLKTATLTGKPSESFNYDSEGRLNAFTVFTNRAGATLVGSLGYDNDTSRLTSRANGTGALAESYFYDAQGNRSSQVKVGCSATTMTYDGQNRLSTYANPSEGVSASYTYDATGQRTRSVVSTTGATTDTSWTYQGLSVLSLAATRSAGLESTWTITYLYDSEDRPYAGVYRSAASKATTFHLVTNAHGDVLALTDVVGSPFASYRYDAYGRDLGALAPGGGTVSASLALSIASRQPLRYAGYVYDSESALYYLSARHYDPATFQFLQKDPAKADGEESAYQYCGGDPVGATDPSGLDSPAMGPYYSPQQIAQMNKKAKKSKKKVKKSRKGYGSSHARRSGSGSQRHSNWKNVGMKAPNLKGMTAEQVIVLWAYSRLGGRYEQVGMPKRGKEWSNYAMDCANLTSIAYRLAHKIKPWAWPELYDYSVWQHDHTRKHSLGYNRTAARLRIGDLGFLHNDSGTVHHVGLYVGRGWVIEARGVAYGVVRTSLRSFNKRGADWHRARRD
jgi:RHS repeat-associated protein